MIIQKELANNTFGHGDLHALPSPGLQQADTRPLATNFTSFRKCDVLLNPVRFSVQYIQLIIIPGGGGHSDMYVSVHIHEQGL